MSSSIHCSAGDTGVRIYLVLWWHVAFPLEVRAQVKRDLVLYRRGRHLDITRSCMLATSLGEVVVEVADGKMAVKWLRVILRGRKRGNERKEGEARERVPEESHHSPAMLQGVIRGESEERAACKEVLVERRTNSRRVRMQTGAYDAAPRTLRAPGDPRLPKTRAVR